MNGPVTVTGSAVACRLGAVPDDTIPGGEITVRRHPFLPVPGPTTDGGDA